MLTFRYYCLDENEKIIRGDNIMAQDLAAAIKAARKLCQSAAGGHPERIEIWQGAKRLYP
jgi:hypothetical protein